MNKDEAQKKESKRYVILTIISLLVLLVLLLFIFVIYPNINKNNKSSTKYSREVSVTDITSESSLDSSNSLVFSYGEDNIETVKFSSSSPTVFIGSYISHNFIYSASGDNPNEVTITYSNVDISNISFVVTISNNVGKEQRILNEDEYVVNNNTFTYSSSSSIYIYKVVIEYYK